MRLTMIGFASIIVGLLISVHELIVHGTIDLADIMHHEWFSAVFISFGLGVLFALKGRKKN